MKIREVAEMTGKSEQTIRNWLRKGKITGTKEEGKWEVEESSVEKYGKKEKRGNESNIEVTETVRQGIEEIKAIVREAKREEKESENQQLAALAKENAHLKQEVAELQAKMAKLEALEKQVAELMQRQETKQERREQQSEQVPQAQVEKRANKKAYKGLEDEERAERWARNNPSEWLDAPSGLELAKEETWRDLATNTSETIAIRGKQQKPRVYLHIIAKNQKVYGWHKVKAKVALELLEGEKQRGCYDSEVMV